MIRRRPLVFVAFLALLASGCGGNLASGTTTTRQARPVAFARCMRANGVAGYPDFGKPTAQQAGVSQSRFDSAVTACEHLLPNGGSTTPDRQSPTQLADERSFARCMRSRGVPHFPDPSLQDGLTVEMVEAQGIDVRSQAVLRIVQRCLPAAHGGLTAAKVREALEHAGG